MIINQICSFHAEGVNIRFLGISAVRYETFINQRFYQCDISDGLTLTSLLERPTGMEFGNLVHISRWIVIPDGNDTNYC